ncbi:hypothetical protein [Phenylobacterium sp.]|uniref:hypothetical protein n=1 Tax=Phenylobacterium sp. TaxID=1871053 RepID=UPI002F91F46C
MEFLAALAVIACIAPLLVCIVGYQWRLEAVVHGRLTEDEAIPPDRELKWLFLVIVVWTAEHRMFRDPELTRWAIAARIASLPAALLVAGLIALAFA